MQRFRGGLVWKAHSLLYHSTLGLEITKKKKESHQREGGGGRKIERARVKEEGRKSADQRRVEVDNPLPPNLHAGQPLFKPGHNPARVATILTVNTNISQNCEAIPRRDRI